MAQDNDEKMKLCKQLENTALEKRNLENQEKALKQKLDPMLKVGERIGLVEKLNVEKLNIGPELLAELEKKYGDKIVRRECDIKVLRAAMAEKPEELKALPKKTSTQIRVGEKWGA